MNINSSYNVITPAAAGADVVVTGTIMSITGAPPIDIRWILNNVYHALPVAETPAQWTATIVAPVAGQTYSYQMSQILPETSPVLPFAVGLPTTYLTNTLALSGKVAHTVTAAGETATQTTTAMNLAVTGYTDPSVGFKLASHTQGAGVITFIAAAGYPLFSLRDTSPNLGVLTLVNTVPGVASRGTVGDLQRAGVNPALLTAGSTYLALQINFSMQYQGGVMDSTHLYTHTVYALNNGANATAFFAAVQTAVGALWV